MRGVTRAGCVFTCKRASAGALDALDLCGHPDVGGFLKVKISRRSMEKNKVSDFVEFF